MNLTPNPAELRALCQRLARDFHFTPETIFSMSVTDALWWLTDAES
jgi:hypothetical protein